MESVDISSYNEGADAQYVEIELGLDREADANGVKPKIKIAGENVRADAIEISAADKTLTLTLHVDKIREGNLTLKLSDKDGSQTLDALIPSGVELRQVAKDDTSVTVEVTHVYDIRGIAWVRFTDGGAPVGGSLLNGADERDGAIAVHGHEFLQDDEYDIAANLAETLTSHFGDRYVFEADGKKVTAKKTGGTNADLIIAIYSYAELSEG
jgi:hypothetical protein